ncbi:MAG: hypothetical protein N3G22_04495 [Candidatus Micrarchaeota archaeon]|nr:hypothetical protein [Candidatus Micrarchaeota archaeon]
MQVSKSGFKHHLYNKIDGLRHLGLAINEHRPPNIFVENFQVLSKRELESVVLDKNRQLPVLVRSSSQKDASFEEWLQQPRMKFPPLEDHYLLSAKLEGFIEWCERQEKAYLSNLVIFAHTLPKSYYAASVSFFIDHGSGNFKIEVRQFEKLYTTYDERSFRNMPMIAKEIGCYQNGNLKIYVRKESENIRIFDIIKKSIGIFASEFKEGVSEINFAVYGHDSSNLYAFDWLLQDGKFRSF